MAVRYALKNAFKFTVKELNLFIISSVVTGFILSFRMWGKDSFNAADGLLNFIAFTLIFMILYFIFIAAQKFTGSWFGYDCKFEHWKYGLLIGFFLTLYLVILFPDATFVVFMYLGTIHLRAIEHLRLGKIWQGVNVRDLMFIGIAGPLAMVIFTSIILAPLYFATGLEIFKNAIYIGGLVIFFSSLPLPNTNGMNVLLYSRKIWFTYFLFGLIFLVLVLSFRVYAFIISLALAILLVFLAKKYSEMHF